MVLPHKPNPPLKGSNFAESPAGPALARATKKPDSRANLVADTQKTGLAAMKYAIALIALLPAAAQAGSTELCMDMGASSSKCSCATTTLNSNITLEERALYDSVGDTFLSAKSGGSDVSEAWETAFSTVAAQNNMTTEDLLLDMASVGEKHEDAISSCQ
jgi:hypothetical protein